MVFGIFFGSKSYRGGARDRQTEHANEPFFRRREWNSTQRPELTTEATPTLDADLRSASAVPHETTSHRSRRPTHVKRGHRRGTATAIGAHLAPMSGASFPCSFHIRVESQVPTRKQLRQPKGSLSNVLSRLAVDSIATCHIYRYARL